MSHQPPATVAATISTSKLNYTQLGVYLETHKAFFLFSFSILAQLDLDDDGWQAEELEEESESKAICWSILYIYSRTYTDWIDVGIAVNATKAVGAGGARANTT